MEPLNSDFTKDFKTANQFLRAQQFQKAIVFYQYALQHFPSSSAAYENLGDAFYQSQQYPEAEAAYNTALSFNSESAHAQAQLGRVLFQQQRYSAAIAAHRQAIALIPTCIPYSYDLAQTLLTQGHPVEAAKVYKRLGTVLRQAGEMEDAIAAYQQALSLQPTSADLHQSMGECYHLQGHFSAAISHYQQVAELSDTPLHLWFYKNWGEALRLSAPVSSASPSSQFSTIK